MKVNKMNESLLDKLSGPDMNEIEKNIRQKYLEGSINIFEYYKKAKELNINGPSTDDFDTEFKKNEIKFMEDAIKNGIVGGVKYAVNNGIDINHRWGNFLFLAVIYNKPMITKILLDNGAEYNNTVMRSAYEKNNEVIVDLLEKKFNINYNKYTRENVDEFLYLATRKNNLEDVKKAIKAGADVNKIIDNNFLKAIYENFEEVAICLLLHGAKVDKFVLHAIEMTKCYKLKELIKYY